jgi:LysR family transcriptional regulator, cell division regulator
VPVCEEELVLYAPGAIKDVFQFIKARTPKVLVFRGGCSYREKLEKLFSEWGMAQVRFLEFSSLDGIFGCVSAGLGVTLFPQALSDRRLWKARWGKTISVHRLPKKDAMVPTVFIRQTDAYVSAALSRLIELLPSIKFDGARR